jgi:hypothetical protein
MQLQQNRSARSGLQEHICIVLHAKSGRAPAAVCARRMMAGALQQQQKQ